MPYHMYVALQEDNKISVFTVDSDSGKLTPQLEVSAPGGPFTLAISPDRKFLYAGCRDVPQINSYQIDQATGEAHTERVGSPWNSTPHTSQLTGKGKFVLSAYYQGAHVGVHPIGGDGSVGEPPIEWLETATGAHAMQTDPTNSYAFVPHIAGNGPQRHLPIPVRRKHRTHHSKFPTQGRPGGVLGTPPLLLPPLAGRALLFERAGLQRDRL